MLLKASASSSISSLQPSSTLTRASRSPWPKALAALAISRRGRLSRRAKADTAITEISTTKAAVVRKMLAILVSTALTLAVGAETMTMPEALPSRAVTGRDTRKRWSSYSPRITPVARSMPLVSTLLI